MAEYKYEVLYSSDEYYIAQIQETIYRDGFFVCVKEVQFDSGYSENGDSEDLLSLTVKDYQKAMNLLHVLSDYWQSATSYDVAHFELVARWLVP